MNNIAILLTVHNRKATTLRCLDMLYHQELPNNCQLEVWLTDDGCTDGTPEAVMQDYPDVHIVKGDGTLYWNRGMHKAWKEASQAKDYDYFLWLNDDTNMYNNAIAELLSASQSKEDKAIIVGATVSPSRPGTTTYGGRNASGSIPPLDGKLQQVHHFNGNIVLVPRYVHNILGNLDPYFTHSKGDFDYGMRASKQGIESYQVGKPLGECETHPRVDKWCDPEIPFRKRWTYMHMPTGMPANETFHLERRHCGLFTASFHWCTNYIRCFFPQLWTMYKQ